MMERIHGPFAEKRRQGSRGANQVVVLETPDGERVPMTEIKNGSCPCRLCRENGGRRMPGTWMFIRGEPDEPRKNVLPTDPLWIAQRPKIDLDVEGRP